MGEVQGSGIAGVASEVLNNAISSSHEEIRIMLGHLVNGLENYRRFHDAGVKKACTAMRKDFAAARKLLGEIRKAAIIEKRARTQRSRQERAAKATAAAAKPTAAASKPAVAKSANSKTGNEQVQRKAKKAKQTVATA